MEQKTNIDLKVEGNELTIRHGEAQELLPPVKPEKVKIKGDFRAVGQYLKGRLDGQTDNLLQLALIKDAIIHTDKSTLSIHLNTNPNNPMATEVTGTAKKSDELGIFHINTGKDFRRDELLKIVRMNRVHFADYQQHSDLLAALKAYRSSTTGSSVMESDTRGNAKLGYEKSVTSNMPETLKLTIPIIKGEAKETFNVDICLEESDGISSFRLESPELNELMVKRTDEMFTRELEHFKEFVVINI
jgi:hypothetical protein